MQWEWDPQKDRQNRQKHGISFESATRVFNDPHQIAYHDPHPDEERFITIGGSQGLVLFVVHTRLTYDPAINDEIGRIISARKARWYEREEYEEGVSHAYR